MDENLVIHNMKSQRLNTKNDGSNGVANIDDLPQAILEHILSFLPMKDAIKTSVLSRKWRYLWTSIPSLTFKESSFSNRELFMNVIERVLLLHDHSPIKQFTLNCTVLDDASRVNAWVSSVVRCNVEDCTILLSCESETFVLCHDLFTCDTLRNLDVVVPTLVLPLQIHLPSLKSLHLQGIEFSNDCLTQQLFSSPALENLHIHHCSWVNLRAISISAPRLEVLSIVERDWETSDNSCQVRISECNLKRLHFVGPPLIEYSLCNLSVVEAVINTSYQTMIQPEVVHRVYKIMHGVCAAQKLKLYGMTIQLLEAGAGFNFQVPLPIFKFLNSLTIDDVKSDVLWKLLQSIPHLQTLQFAKDEEESSEIGGEISDQVPSCIFSSLKKFVVKFVSLDAGEMYMLKTILKHTRELQKFVIVHTSIEQCNVEWMKLLWQLVECPRGSKKCKIIVQSILASKDLRFFFWDKYKDTQFNGGAFSLVALKWKYICI